MYEPSDAFRRGILRRAPTGGSAVHKHQENPPDLGPKLEPLRLPSHQVRAPAPTPACPEAFVGAISLRPRGFVSSLCCASVG